MFGCDVPCGEGAGQFEQCAAARSVVVSAAARATQIRRSNQRWRGVADRIVMGADDNPLVLECAIDGDDDVLAIVALRGGEGLALDLIAIGFKFSSNPIAAVLIGLSIDAAVADARKIGHVVIGRGTRGPIRGFRRRILSRGGNQIARHSRRQQKRQHEQCASLHPTRHQHHDALSSP